MNKKGRLKGALFIMAGIGQINLPDPWKQVKDEQTQEILVKELQSELSSVSPLFGCHIKAIARRTDCDDVLFEICSATLKFKLALVHLTWSGDVETSPWPVTELFIDAGDFVAQQLKSNI